MSIHRRRTTEVSVHSTREGRGCTERRIGSPDALVAGRWNINASTQACSRAFRPRDSCHRPLDEPAISRLARMQGRSDFVGTPRGALSIHDARPGTVRPWSRGARPFGRAAVTSAARRCRTAASLFTGSRSDTALRVYLPCARTRSRQWKVTAFLPLPRERERFSVASVVLSNHIRRGIPCTEFSFCTSTRLKNLTAFKPTA
jgi:hypothetical protein